MFKPEFIKKLAEKLGCPRKEAENHLDAALDLIQETLSAGEDVHFVKFGKWEPKTTPAGDRPNPLKNGEISHHPEKRRVKFTAAKDFLGAAETSEE